MQQGLGAVLGAVPGRGVVKTLACLILTVIAISILMGLVDEGSEP